MVSLSRTLSGSRNRRTFCYREGVVIYRSDDGNCEDLLWRTSPAKIFQALNTRELEVICCSGELLLTRGGGDLVSLSLLQRSGSLSHCFVDCCWFLSHCSGDLALSLSLLTIWFLSHCSDVRWRRSRVEKGGGYLVIDINYFPGYEKLPCYETVMTNFFLNLMKSHTVEKTTADD
ncbi:hypothetical protein L6452_18244 [Arctium lappa]|uniref:Uncharacterized protein n=1 Tax=Arctium lappa TaxID=4217 RepID=A0ACB9C5T2_ARCLA|nr:hypothetical protein L6452_18244 [Arctium lappa]